MMLTAMVPVVRNTGRRAPLRGGTSGARHRGQTETFELIAPRQSQIARTTIDDLPILDAEWIELAGPDIPSGDHPHALYARTCLLGRGPLPQAINYYA